MKKFIALILCLLLTLTACGRETAPETTAAPETTSAPETEAPTTEPQAAFDPHWAGAEYEMPIPQPPFTQFVVEDKGGMFTINSADPAELAEITEEVFNAYCDALVEAGSYMWPTSPPAKAISASPTSTFWPIPRKTSVRSCTLTPAARKTKESPLS